MTTAAEFRALAKRVATLPERVVRAGAAEMNRAIITELRADTGGDQVLSGAGGRRRRRTKLATTTRITGGTSIATAVIAASPRRARAQWSWLEEGTATRTVGRLERKRSGPGGKHLRIGGNWITGPVDAGRSPAKHTWGNGVRRGRDRALRAMQDEFDRTMNS